MRKFRQLIIAVSLIPLVACREWQPETRPVPLVESAMFRYTIQIETAEGNKFILTRAHVSDGKLIGFVGKAELSIPVSDVVHVKVYRYDSKTTWSTIGFIGDVLGGVADGIPSGKKN